MHEILSYMDNDQVTYRSSDPRSNYITNVAPNTRTVLSSPSLGVPYSLVLYVGAQFGSQSEFVPMYICRFITADTECDTLANVLANAPKSSPPPPRPLTPPSPPSPPPPGASPPLPPTKPPSPSPPSPRPPSPRPPSPSPPKPPAPKPPSPRPPNPSPPPKNQKSPSAKPGERAPPLPPGACVPAGCTRQITAGKSTLHTCMARTYTDRTNVRLGHSASKRCGLWTALWTVPRACQVAFTVCSQTSCKPLTNAVALVLLMIRSAHPATPPFAAAQPPPSHAL